MWLSLLLLALLPAAADAATVASVSCREMGAMAECRIALEGAVTEGDRLFLSRVHDIDSLHFQGHELGATGRLFGRPFAAGFLPRLYPLQALRGIRSPVLTLRAHAMLGHAPGIPAGASVAIVDERFPLRRILGPAALSVLALAGLFSLAAYLLTRSDSGKDGWLFPSAEFRWLVISLAALLALRTEAGAILVPSLLSEKTDLFLQRTAMALVAWSLGILLLKGRFSDRSCVEPVRLRWIPLWLSTGPGVVLIFTLGLLSFRPGLPEWKNALLLSPLLALLLLAAARVVQETEWQRILKRSSLSSSLFLGTLFFVSLALIGTHLPYYFGRSANPLILHLSAWATLIAAALRLRSLGSAESQSRALAAECRENLLREKQGSQRLEALCGFIEREWGAARVSLISVAGESGLVLASAGPDAIPPAQKLHPRRLGPFLRRVCKRRHILYAPVAEELGKDLQDHGLRHSSLAIPVLQGEEVRAVLCIMADEDERIPPAEALQVELLADALQLEILSNVDLHEAEERNSHLLTIARMANGLAVEHLDRWGHIQKGGSESRVLLGADNAPLGVSRELLGDSPLLAKAWTAYRAELRILWVSLAESFEFIHKESREEFWVVSPREFRNPALQSLGAQRVALLLAATLERHARALASRDCYLLLGHQASRVVLGNAELHFHASEQAASVELDPESFAQLVTLKQEAAPGALLYRGDPAALADLPGRFSCRMKPFADPAEQIFSILTTSADKKEMRRLENQALERSRFAARKAA